MKEISSKRKGNGSSGLSFLAMPLTREQILERGFEASQLLRAPAFNLAFRSTIQRWQDEILETEEHETRKREGLYLKMHALGEAVDELGGYYRLADSLSAEKLSEEERARLAMDAAQTHGYVD